MCMRRAAIAFAAYLTIRKLKMCTESHSTLGYVMCNKLTLLHHKSILVVEDSMTVMHDFQINLNWIKFRQERLFRSCNEESSLFFNQSILEVLK